MRIECELRPLEDVVPWTDADGGNPHLSWFTFSDGFYRIQVGPDYLLNYSDQVVARWSQDGWIRQEEDPRYVSYVDYEIAEFWEDTLDMLPDVLRPVPGQLAEFLEQGYGEISTFADGYYDWHEESAPSDSTSDTFDAATAWLGPRTLHAGYLKFAPHIWMWSDDDNVTIAWDNRGLVSHGVPVWSAQRGQYSLSRADFLAAARSFSDRFIAQMAERVKQVHETWDLQKAQVDFSRLETEHEERASYFEEVLKRSPSFERPWDDVIQAMEIVRLS